MHVEIAFKRISSYCLFIKQTALENHRVIQIFFLLLKKFKTWPFILTVLIHR